MSTTKQALTAQQLFDQIQQANDVKVLLGEHRAQLRRSAQRQAYAELFVDMAADQAMRRAFQTDDKFAQVVQKMTAAGVRLDVMTINLLSTPAVMRRRLQVGWLKRLWRAFRHWWTGGKKGWIAQNKASLLARAIEEVRYAQQQPGAALDGAWTCLRTLFDKSKSRNYAGMLSGEHWAMLSLFTHAGHLSELNQFVNEQRDGAKLCPHDEMMYKHCLEPLKAIGDMTEGFNRESLELALSHKTRLKALVDRGGLLDANWLVTSVHKGVIAAVIADESAAMNYANKCLFQHETLLTDDQVKTLAKTFQDVLQATGGTATEMRFREDLQRLVKHRNISVSSSGRVLDTLQASPPRTPSGKAVNPQVEALRNTLTGLLPVTPDNDNFSPSRHVPSSKPAEPVNYSPNSTPQKSNNGTGQNNISNFSPTSSSLSQQQEASDYMWSPSQ